MLVDGVWSDANPKAPGADGRFRRRVAAFRAMVGEDPRFPVESGRYVLIAAYPCPWSHRALLARSLIGLERAVPLLWADSVMGREGWEIAGEVEGASGRRPLHRRYTDSNPSYTGSASVPVLWDPVARTIVNNESTEIVRMFCETMAELGDHPRDLKPAGLAAEVDRVADLLHSRVNEGVYRAGYASTQQAYDEAVSDVFEGMAELDGILAARPFLSGDAITLADLFAYPTLIRFDPIYSVLMRCNLRRITEYEHLFRYLVELHGRSEFHSTVDLDEYRRGYYANLKQLNPGGIIPAGPVLAGISSHRR